MDDEQKRKDEIIAILLAAGIWSDFARDIVESIYPYLYREAKEGMKLVKGAIGKKAEDITNFYWEAFKQDFKKLNITSPNIWCKATEHIKEQIELIKKLEKKGFTYKTSDGIYFDTSKFKNYGKIALLKKEGLEAGKRIDMFTE